MSTKLYGGLRAKDPSMDVFAACRAVKPIAERVFRRLSERSVAGEVAHRIDQFSVLMKPEVRAERLASRGHSPFDDARKAWLDQQRSMNPRMLGQDPYRFEMSFGHAPDGRLLAYLFSDRGAYRSSLLRSGLFEDYHYQNQTDGTSGVSMTAWKKREADWESVLNDDGDFSDLPQWRLPGTVEGVYSFDVQYEGLKHARFPTRKERLRRILIESAEVMVSVGELAPPLQEGFRMSEVLDRRRAVAREVDLRIARGGIALPRVLPPMRWSWSKIDQEPQYRPSARLVRAIAQRAAASFDPGA